MEHIQLLPHPGLAVIDPVKVYLDTEFLAFSRLIRDGLLDLLPHILHS